MNELEDIKLKMLLQEMKLESPKADFSSRVMHKIFAEDIVLEKIKSERILGKGFWIITTLFVVLIASMFIFQNTGINSTSGGEINQFLNGIDNTQGYQSFFQKIGTVPLSIAGIFIAVSVLLFIDRFITSNMKVFS
ncbi:MAG: hypothetical protein R2757_16705 [Draconibacterium sp.]